MIDENSFVWASANPHHDKIEEFAQQIRESSEGILVSPDGKKACVLSNRKTEIFLEFDVPDGADFREMRKTDIRQFMKEQLMAVGIDDIDLDVTVNLERITRYDFLHESSR